MHRPIAPAGGTPSDQNMLVVNSRIKVPRDEFQWSFARSSGPGGQNVNKVSSKAVLRWPVAASAALPAEVRQRFMARYRRRITREGELVLSSQRYRDQGRNIDDCLEKLTTMLVEVATVPRARRATRPTRGSTERRLKRKQELSSKKQLRRTVPESTD